MKKLIALLLCLTMCLACVAMMASCDILSGGEETTTPAPNDETTTKATFLGDEDHLYLPFAFAKSVGLAKDGDKTYNHYGVAYVDITAALESCGKTVTRDEDMLVLADKALTEDEMLVLYRALY